MRTETRTVRIGEWLGPVDWDYDFRATGWDQGGSGNPDLIVVSMDALRAAEHGLKAGEEWWLTSHGTDHRIIKVGMYDGWPYWEPTPSYLYETLFGCESTSWFGLRTWRKG
jgi:hypothetical protein